MSKLCPLFSGSSGNCYYISSGSTAILIDAGKSAKQIENALRDNNLNIKNIKAIFITHEHTDHINALRVFASRYNIDVFSSNGTAEILKQKQILNGKFKNHIISPNKGVDIENLHIVPFRTSHDCLESFGYTVYTPDNKKIGIATDLGYISDEVFNSIRGSDTVVIESNHDIGMLENGAYPYHLKRRILSNKGHLSNIACANILPDLVNSGTKRFMLAHLSKENNMVELAYQTALSELEAMGLKLDFDFHLKVAPEYNSGNNTFIF